MRFIILLAFTLSHIAVAANLKTPTACSTNIPSELEHIIQKTLQDLQDSEKSPGIVVAIYHPNLGYIHKAYGLDYVKKNIKMQEDRVFDIGSVMKTFRWVLLLKLHESGSLNLTDPINQHIEFPALQNRKLSDLMLHSTGMIDINDSQFFNNVMSGRFSKTYSFTEMIKFLVSATNHQHPQPFTNGLTDMFSVGSDFRYSSFGSLVAGEIAHQKLGKDLPLLIQEEILDRYKLANTTFMAGRQLPINFAHGYQKKSNQTWQETANIPDTEGVSSGFGRAMYSTACDLVQYTHEVYNDDHYLSKATLDLMTNTTNPIYNDQAKAGLGVFNYLNTWGAGFWGHLGANVGHGHSSGIANRRQDQLSVVVLSNVDPEYNQYALQFKLIKNIGEYFNSKR